jgi:hypothetical protein
MYFYYTLVTLIDAGRTLTDAEYMPLLYRIASQYMLELP